MWSQNQWSICEARTNGLYVKPEPMVWPERRQGGAFHNIYNSFLDNNGGTNPNWFPARLTAIAVALNGGDFQFVPKTKIFFVISDVGYPYIDIIGTMF